MNSGVHVLGAGAVGTVLAAHLAEARIEPQLLVREQDLERMAQVEQMCIDRVAGRGTLSLPKPAVHTHAHFREGDVVLICVKHRDLDAAIALIEADSAKHLRLVPCLNGVGAAATLRKAFPQHDVAAMTIMFNAQLLEPLHARITTQPDVLLHTRDKDLLALFRRTHLRVRQAKDESTSWGKLLINLGNALCALTHTTFHDLLADPDLRRCNILMLDEAVSLVEEAGIRYTLPMPMPYPLYRQLILHGGPLPWWVARIKNGLTRLSYPSMVADVAAGKETEVAQLNGEIVRLAADLGRKAPVNTCIVEMIQALHGQSPADSISPSTLRERLQSA